MSKEKLQRPPAELLHEKELARLDEADAAPRPPGWRLSLTAARDFILGNAALEVAPKFVGDPSLVERSLVTLATNRGLMLVGDPGTAKSLLSELMAAAVSGDSTLTVQGGAATTEDQIAYSWNYSLLVSEGPSERALVPAPLLDGMREGKVVRFEEITRCPLEVQDSLLSPLSDRALAIAELEGEQSMVFAREGFTIIGTANTRDRGVNDMSAALKRRFNFETVFPIADFDTELALVQREADRILKRSGVPEAPEKDVLAVLVRVFRDLREGDGTSGRLQSALSTAEAVSVAHSMGVKAWYTRQERATAGDIVDCIAGAAAKDSADDTARLRRYLEQKASKRKGEHWADLYAARHGLPG
ncbi:ATP-binding protein [Salininema proteolyticum]|uniref:AAA family ATPase n=1 Tax=Salininema proteolyticum TaxID=1607685 RepID=A0ABV8TY91_9ACTN